ncbi:MAG: hypothetical protein M1821_005698 [Bathelium mastoideum]|nr:MAG: hypothetical protein M1821_005698 [Bathelium mastoideum]
MEVMDAFVFELLGPSLIRVSADYGRHGERLKPEIILKITKQLLQAVASLHRAGYAHGNVSGVNTVFTCRHLTRSSKKEALRIIGLPEWENLVRLDGQAIGRGMPKQLVKTAIWDDWVEEDEEDIKLINFGQAFSHGNEPTNLTQPPGLEAPETIFTDSIDYRINLWRVGIVIYNLLFASMPFPSPGDIYVVVLQMIDFVEELPEEWVPKWTLMKAGARREWDKCFSTSSLIQLSLKTTTTI